MDTPVNLLNQTAKVASKYLSSTSAEEDLKNAANNVELEIQGIPLYQPLTFFRCGNGNIKNRNGNRSII